MKWIAAILALAAAGCGSTGSIDNGMPATVDIKIIAFNDLHGNLEPPKLAIAAPGPGGVLRVPAGGAAYLADAIRTLRQRNPNHAVVSAGDMIGASPLVSALFLDEPTIEAVNEIGIDFNAVGNHEFDKGRQELLRMQHGGCARYTAREPCRLGQRFAGANFGFLAANTFTADGGTLFPPTGIKTFGSGAAQVKVGFIGLTLKGTPGLVTPDGVAGLRFGDEAQTANALVPVLKVQGADVIVAIVHEGGITSGDPRDLSCPGLSGGIVPILEQLDPAIDVVVSGHTHRAYVCDYSRRNPGKPFLLTSAGQYGMLVTDIDLKFDLGSRKLAAKSAVNTIVQGEPYTDSNGATVDVSPLYPRFAKQPAVERIVMRYAAAAAPLAQRVAGALRASATRAQNAAGESVLGNLIADAQLTASGAQIVFMNPGGMRADLLVPDGGGNVSYGDLFGAQPFGNNVVTKRMSGAQVHAVLEQQFASGRNSVATPRVLSVSRGFSYAYRPDAATGSRVVDMRLDGQPLLDANEYRVGMNSYLAAGGDDFSVFLDGRDANGGALDIDALEHYLRAASSTAPLTPPATGRIRRLAH